MDEGGLRVGACIGDHAQVKLLSVPFLAPAYCDHAILYLHVSYARERRGDAEIMRGVWQRYSTMPWQPTLITYRLRL